MDKLTLQAWREMGSPAWRKFAFRPECLLPLLMPSVQTTSDFQEAETAADSMDIAQPCPD
jgi:hypothetical protein